VNWLTHAKNAVRMDAEIGLKAVEHLLGLYTAARLRLGRASLRCEGCGSYQLVGGECEHCGWVDPSYEPPEACEISDEERARQPANAVRAQLGYLDVQGARGLQIETAPSGKDQSSAGGTTMLPPGGDGSKLNPWVRRVLGDYYIVGKPRSAARQRPLIVRSRTALALRSSASGTERRTGPQNREPLLHLTRY
jgi:hypothetical protein